MAAELEFTLNGSPARLAGCSTNTTLLEYLRAAGLTGAKEGCAEGDCGACSVAVIERDAEGRPIYRAINSCLMPVCLLAGREVVTVEGVGCTGRLHPVQAKLVEHFGSQCGYCTPGIVCSLFEGYYRPDLKTEDDLDDQLSGNLCRCTGYRPIRDSAKAAFAARNAANGKDLFTERLSKASVKLSAVEYRRAAETFLRPQTLTDLLRQKQDLPNARLIAGATELGLDITKRFATFPTLISIEGVAELRKTRSTDSEWEIGAAVTLTEIEEKLAGEFPILRDMLRVFGSRQIRNRATMGGNLVTASPIGDSAPILLALDARVVLASLQGERRVAIDDFFVGYRKTALLADEVLKTIIIPRGTPSGLARHSAWYKVSKRREMDISTVAACFVVDVDAENRVRHARLAYGGVAATPVRARRTEAALLGKEWNEATIQEGTTVLQSEFSPISDVRGTDTYRAGLITGLLEKFFRNESDKDYAPLEVRDRREALSTDPPHESAHKHVTGEAIYPDDQTAGMLEVWPVLAPHARARILKRDATAARKMPGIHAVLLAEDIPGVNDVGPVKHDEILLAKDDVYFHSHPVALVVGESQSLCRAATEKVVVEYEPLSPVITIQDAIARDSFHNAPNFIRRGDVEAALRESPMTLAGEFELGGQEHFYLEMQSAWAERGEDGTMYVASSTQHPSEVQQAVANVLGLPANKVVVQVPRVGGGFGGKETQAATPAALAALAAHRTGRQVRVRFNRDQDMMLTGHRHPFLARFKIGFDPDGMLRAAQVHLWSNGGWSLDLSQAVTDRALFHLDNAYYIPAAEFRGQVAKTNLSSNTAFRGFGGPQGMLLIEEILDRIARRLGLPPEVVRERNLYRGKAATNTTHYGQEIGDNRIQTIWHELKRTAELEQRRAEITDWNSKHIQLKRGLAITPVKFGISFTVTHLNQAGAFVLIYQDGTVQVNHGGTEMGQGVHTNVAMIAARELGVTLDRIRVMPTSTDKVPNTSATAASCGTDLNGAAVKNACDTLRTRLAPIAAKLISARLGREIAADQVQFVENLVFERGAHAPSRVLSDASSDSAAEVRRETRRTAPETDALPESIPFADVVKAAYFQRVSLSATGYYATPDIHWDRDAGRGKPFHYFAYGAAVTEVEVDGCTGMHRVLRVDILHDAGDSVNEGVNRGQIEGGFVQGMGWLTTEELLWDDKGRLLTHSPDTYKIPSVGDMPRVFNVTLLPNATQKDVIHGSKAVGEPPLMLAISVREAIRDAVAAFGSGNTEIELASPATCEAIWWAIQKVKRAMEHSTPHHLVDAN